jgi:Cytochrome c7 and related cytochrome c
MSQLFPSWSTAVARLFWIGCGVVLVGVPCFLMWWTRTPYVTGQYTEFTQPIAFDHRHHVVDDGIDCLYCHTDAERSPHAGVPATSVCLNCHSQIWDQSPMLQALWTSFEEDRPIVWQRVTFLPDFVYFNHAIHVQKGVGCETCHGRVDQMARVYQVAPLTMGWCLQCHRNPARYLRPVSDVTQMGYKPARPQLEVGTALVKQYHVLSLTNCTTCHR